MPTIDELALNAVMDADIDLINGLYPQWMKVKPDMFKRENRDRYVTIINAYLEAVSKGAHIDE